LTLRKSWNQRRKWEATKKKGKAPLAFFEKGKPPQTKTRARVASLRKKRKKTISKPTKGARRVGRAKTA